MGEGPFGGNTLAFFNGNCRLGPPRLDSGPEDLVRDGVIIRGVISCGIVDA